MAKLIDILDVETEGVPLFVVLVRSAGRYACSCGLYGRVTLPLPVISVLVTTYGLEKNEYSGKFQKVVTMEELFS